MAPPSARLITIGERCRRSILGCDMPERKRFNWRRWRSVQYVEDVARMLRLSVRGHKNGHEIRGHFSKYYGTWPRAAQKRSISETVHLQGLRGRNREGPHCAARRGPRSSAHDRWRPSGGQTG